MPYDASVASPAADIARQGYPKLPDIDPKIPDFVPKIPDIHPKIPDFVPKLPDIVRPELPDWLLP
jgi:hypothetical protein